MNELPKISSYWMGTRLSFLEQLCLKSFADLGHETTLYSYEEVANPPEGVTVKDGRSILPESVFQEFKTLGHAAVFSDKFRLHMLTQTDEIWVDTDAYAWARFPNRDYMFARDVPTRLASGVLRLPKNSPALQAYLDFTSTSYPDLPNDWPLNFKFGRLVNEKPTEKLHITEMPDWSWGPIALQYFLSKSGEIEHEMDGALFYPLEGISINQVFQRFWKIKKRIPEKCLSVHLFGSLLRRKLRRRFPEGNIPESSFLKVLCDKHEIDPLKFPVK